MPGLLRDLVALYQHIQDPDKAKRDAATAYFAANPQAYQQLIDSHMADDPNTLKQIFGNNARFGANSNASSNIINNIQASPLSEAEKANRLEDVQKLNPNDIANAGIKSIPSLRAYNGLTNDQMSQQAPNIASVLAANSNVNSNSNVQNQVQNPLQTQNPPINIQQVATQIAQNGNQNQSQTLLSPQQQDILSKQRTGETSLDVAKGKADIQLVNAERDSAIANAARTRQAMLSDQAQGEILQRKNLLEKNSDQLIDQYYQSHPDARSRSVVDIMGDKTVSPEVRAAFINSGKYGESTKTQLANHYEQARIDLEKRGQDISKQEHDEWLPKLQQATALDAYAKTGFAGPKQGYIDLFTGNINTPEAQAAQSILQTGSPQIKAQSISQYNSIYAKLQSMLSSKTPPSNDNIQNYIEMLNTRAADLRSKGINQPDVKYDIIPPDRLPWYTNMNQAITPEVGRRHSLQTLNGNDVTLPTYDPKTDPGLVHTSDGKIFDPDKFAAALNNSQNFSADLAATLADPRLSPAMKAQILQRVKNKKGTP